MAKMSISKAWEESKVVLLRDGRLFTTVALGLLVLPQTALGTFSPTAPAEMTTALLASLLLVVVLALAAQVTINRLAIPPSFTVADAMKRGFEKLLPLIVAMIPVFIAVLCVAYVAALFLAVTGIGSAPAPGAPPPIWLLAVLVLSGLAIYSIFQLMIAVAAAEPGGPLVLLSRAWRLGRPHYWRLTAFLAIVWAGVFFFWIVGQITSGVAVAAISGPPATASIGAIFVSLVRAVVQAMWTVTTSVMLARIYVQVAGASVASVPSSGT